MAIDPNTLLNEGRCLSCNSNASESEIILLALLQRIAEAGASGGGGGAPSGPLNAVQFQSPLGTFAGSSDLTFNDTTNVLALTGSQTIATSANTTALALTGYSLTGANAQSMVSLAGTVNTTGVPHVIDQSIIATASGTNSSFLRMRGGVAGTTERFLFALDGGGYTTSGWNYSNGAFGNINLSLGGGAAGILWVSTFAIKWTSQAAGSVSVFAGTADTGITRSAAGVVQINNGTLGTLRDISLRNIITNNAAAAFTTATTLTDFAGASLGTLSNAPSAGNPAKWIAIVDNGTTRYIPTWI